jgi:hypothetical protein
MNEKTGVDALHAREMDDIEGEKKKVRHYFNKELKQR